MNSWRFQAINGNWVNAPVPGLMSLGRDGTRDPTIPSLPLGNLSIGQLPSPLPEIELRSSNVVAWASRTNTTWTAPAGIVNGDIITIFQSYDDGTLSPPAPTPPTGFAHYNPGAVGPLVLTNGTVTTVHLYLYWKRASNESGNYTVTHPTGNSSGFIGAWINCLESGTPFGAQSTDSTDTTTLGIANSLVTTASRSRLIFQEMDFTGGGGLTPPAGMIELRDEAIYLAWQRIATIETTGTRRHTNGGGGKWSARMTEMLAATGNRRIEPTSRNFTVTRASTY